MTDQELRAAQFATCVVREMQAAGWFVEMPEAVNQDAVVIPAMRRDGLTIFVCASGRELRMCDNMARLVDQRINSALKTITAAA